MHAAAPASIASIAAAARRAPHVRMPCIRKSVRAPSACDTASPRPARVVYTPSTGHQSFLLMSSADKNRTYSDPSACDTASPRPPAARSRAGASLRRLAGRCTSSCCASIADQRRAACRPADALCKLCDCCVPPNRRRRRRRFCGSAKSIFDSAESARAPRTLARAGGSRRGARPRCRRPMLECSVLS